MTFADKYRDTLHNDSSFWFKVIVIGWMNFFTFIIAGLVYFIPIDLTWESIGKAPAILLGAACLYIYATFFAVILIIGSSK